MLGMADARLVRERVRGRTTSDAQAGGGPERASLSELQRPLEGRPDLAADNVDQGFQGLGNQLVRYIPTELIGAYVFFVSLLNPIPLPTACGSDFSSRWWALIAFTAAAPILEWLIYRARARQINAKATVPWFECGVSALAFFAWAIALPLSPMFSFCDWKAGYGAFAAGAVAVVIPLVSAALGFSLTTSEGEGDD